MCFIKVDFNSDEFKKFADKLRQLSGAEADALIDACAKELAARPLRMVIKRTPVYRPKYNGAKTIKIKGASGKVRSFLTDDYVRYQKYWQGYVGGTLRRGWTSETHEEAENGHGNGKNIADYLNTVQVKRNGKVHEISIFNPVSYAKYVEYGHRQTPGRYVPALGKRLKQGWVRGRFAMTRSVKEIDGAAAAVVEKKLKAKLKEVFG